MISSVVIRTTSPQSSVSPLSSQSPTRIHSIWVRLGPGRPGRLVDSISMAEKWNQHEDYGDDCRNPQAGDDWPRPQRAAGDEIKRAAEREGRERQQIRSCRLKEDLERCAP